MMFPYSLRRLALTLVLLATALPLTAQDTRGSLVPDAKVLLADGTTREAEDVKQGAELFTWLPDGKAGAAKVTAVRRQHTDSFILLKAGEREFRATGSHRVALVGGTFMRLDALKVGDKVLLTGPKGPVEASVTSLRLYMANLVAYDLTVEGHRPIVVDGVVVGD